MGQVVQMEPRGHYLANEAGALAGVSGGTIGQWARNGYITASQSRPGDFPLVYSYQDVAEAMIVHELLDEGASHEEVKAAINNLREESGGSWPLTHGGVSTVGGSVVVRRGEARYEVGQRPWQRFVDPVHLREIADELNRGGWATRQLPDLRHIEVDPDRLSGRPTIRGRRVPVSLVAELADEEDGPEALREDYDLEPAEIKDARRWTDVTRSFALAA